MFRKMKKSLSKARDYITGTDRIARRETGQRRNASIRLMVPRPHLFCPVTPQHSPQPPPHLCSQPGLDQPETGWGKAWSTC
ncbi:hypothetical protein ElyMa_003996800 [Elysia marginata]|uniref:Uncharacterized protein n=1 Tax=Elysia marginata TaxID=1093978 RepID=A0AAV4FZ51_9GAST|nr:hypothetical protein ElyMa_003996800 [Elysia marginata]